MAEESCNCPASTVEYCFEDGFSKRNPSIYKIEGEI